MRTPHPFLEPVGPPASGQLFAVRYRDSRAQHVTTMYRRRRDAQQLVCRVKERGGTAVLFVTTVADWEVTW